MKKFFHSVVYFSLGACCSVALQYLLAAPLSYNLLLLHEVITIFVFFTLLSAVCSQIIFFTQTDYTFYKLAGADAYTILKFFYADNSTLFCICACIAAVFASRGSLVLYFPLFLFYTALYLAVSLCLYILRHFKFWYRFVTSFLVLFALGFTGYILLIYADNFAQLHFSEFVSLLLSLPFVRFLTVYFLAFEPFSLLATFTLLLVLLFLVKVTDELPAFADEHSTVSTFSSNFPLRFADKSFIRVLYRALINVRMMLRKKLNLIFYAALSAFIIFLLLNSNDIEFLLPSACLGAVLLNASVEYLFREDFYTISVYKLCGESFRDFFLHKLVALAILAGPFTLTALGKLSTCSLASFLFTFVFMLFSMCYWVSFYAARFQDLKANNNLSDAVRTLIALVIILIPFVNFVVLLYFVNVGKKRWKEKIA